VMATTYALLSEAGLAGVTVDEVARRSGVAKTTIYRHWPSRQALLLGVCGRMGPHFDLPDGGSLPKDLHALAQRVVEQLLAGSYAAILVSLMDAAECDPDLASSAAYARLRTWSRSLSDSCCTGGCSHTNPSQKHSSGTS